MRNISIIHATLGLALLVAAGCFRQDIITTEISIPQMGSSACQNAVMRALGRLDHEAIVKAEFDIDQRIARVTYDSRRVGLKNIEFVITAAGFDANDEQADEESRRQLPEACR